MKRSSFSTLKTVALAAALASGFTLSAQAADYPSKTIQIVVPWKAGGGTDRIARGFAEALKAASGQSVVVVNVGGAGSITGTIKVARSKADGYTMLLNMDSAITGAMTYQKVPVSLDDFTYIGGVYTSPTWILSHKDTGITDLGQFIKKAKGTPKKMTIGTAGPAGSPMLMAAAIRGYSGIDVRIIPYDGGAALKKALLGNQVTAGVIHAPVLLKEVEAGMISVLGAGESLKDIAYEPLRATKTLRDYGIGADFGLTRAIFVPKKTPADVVAKLRKLVKTAVESEAYAKFGRDFGFSPVWMEGSAFRAGMESQLTSFKDIKTRYVDGAK